MKIRILKIVLFTWMLSLSAVAASHARDVTLQWSAVADTTVTGYKVYYNADKAGPPFSGTGATQGASPIDVKKVTSATVTGLDPSRSYYFAVTAYDASGTQSSYSNGVNVLEGIAPTASITFPASNATVSGTVSVTASASDNVGVTKVEFYVNGSLKGSDTTTPYLYSWNTSSLAAGTYTLMSKAYDAAGNVGQSSNLPVSIVNDTTAPSVSITAPANGATVSGTKTITASAIDNVGVTKVEYYDNGALLTANNVAPFSYNWNTASVADGSHILTVKAYDNTGNVGQSANVSVTVNNSTTIPSGSIVAVFGNAAGSTYANTVEDTFININGELNATLPYLNTYTWPANTPANSILMKWALSSLPANAQIQSATLSLHLNDSGGDALYEMPVSAIINKAPVISQSNGTTYDGVNAWSSSSVPYGGIPLAQSDIAAAADAPIINQTLGYKSWNVTSIVKNWVASPANNRGLLVNASSKSTADSYRLFASSEAADAATRPKLSVTYTLATASDGTAPAASITAPAAGATVSGTPTVTASATDNVGVSKVEFYVNGTLKATDAAAPYSFAWATASVTNGTYTLSVKAYDAAGNVGQSANVSATVNNAVADATKPTVSLTAPASSAKVSGTVSVNASATDNVRVSKVEFYRNGVLQSTDTAAPFSYSWNTASVANGSYTLSVKAYDAAGNVGSALVTVSVANSITYTAVFGNATGSTYTNTVEDTFLNINNEVNAPSGVLYSYTWPANTPANAVLLKWALSSLPAGAQIQNATLSLYLTGSGGDALYEMPASEIINKTPVISKSNGNSYDGVNSWSPSSVPYGGVPLAQSDKAVAADAPLIDKIAGYKKWNVTNIVKNWVATPANNKGLLVNSSSKATANSYRVFASSEAADATKRPKLVVTYILN